MDYDFGPRATELREHLQDLIHTHIPETFLGAFTHDPAALELTQRFCRVLADEGLLCLSWPAQYGGLGASVWEQTVVREEMWAHHEPRGPQYMGVNWIGPAIMRYGTTGQKAQHLPPIARGEVIWCQGFSEPEAGSDLASLRTRAVPTPDGWLISGQKVWTSYATMASWCVLAAATEPDAPKNRRLTLFLIPMDRPGIEVRPIEAMVGPHHLNEVFLDGVRAEPGDVLGEVGDGWRVMKDALAYERIGIARYARCQSLMARLADELDDEFAELPASLHERWGRATIDVQVAKLLAYAAIGGEDDGVDLTSAAIARIATTTLDQTVAELLFDTMGEQALDAGAASPLHGAIEDHWRYAQASTIASGSIEIQRTIVARHTLGGR